MIQYDECRESWRGRGCFTKNICDLIPKLGIILVGCIWSREPQGTSAALPRDRFSSG